MILITLFFSLFPFVFSFSSIISVWREGAGKKPSVHLTLNKVSYPIERLEIQLYKINI